MSHEPRPLWACLALTAALTFCFGEEDKDKNEEKPVRLKREVVVTATMTSKEVNNCSSSVSVVTEDVINASNASNALNLLHFLPGVFVERTGDFGRADVDIRGLGSNGRRISIMIDGRPEKMGLFGCIITHSFPLDNVSRIEVVRGPSSVLYGSDALGGVVNILTKKIDEGFHTDLTASYGTFHSQHYRLRHGGNIKSFNYYFTLDKRLSDGHLKNSGYDGQDFTGRLGCSLSKAIDVVFQGKYFSGKKYEPGTELMPLADYWNAYQRGALDLTISGRWQKAEASLKLYWNFGYHEFSDGWESRDSTAGGLLRYTSRALANNEFTVGADFRDFGGERMNPPPGEWRKNECGLFVHDEHVLFKKVIVTAGARLQRDSLYGIEFCPHLGAVYHIRNGTRLKAGISKGFRSPQINELYMLPTSNTELKPEAAWNYEVGAGQSFSRWLVVDITVFDMRGDNLIETGFNPSPPPNIQFLNKGRFHFKGVEGEVKIEPSRDFRGALHYTYLDPGEHTKGKARHKWDLTALLNSHPLSASLNLQYVSDYHAGDHSGDALPDYFLAQAKIDCHVSHHFLFYLALNNIFDEKYKIYVELPGAAAGAYRMPGRTMTLGAQLIF